MKNNLHPKMQARLDQWRANLVKPKAQEIVKKKYINNFVPRRDDFGDDLSDFQNNFTKYFEK
jgi:hypothetical protein